MPLSIYLLPDRISFQNQKTKTADLLTTFHKLPQEIPWEIIIKTAHNQELKCLELAIKINHTLKQSYITVHSLKTPNDQVGFSVNKFLSQTDYKKHIKHTTIRIYNDSPPALTPPNPLEDNEN